MPDEKIDQKRPAQAESELKKMQQRLVDETVDESFPASDPPAWTTTGAKSVAARTESGSTGERRSDPRRGSGPLRGVTEQAGHLAEGARRAGERYLEEARRRLPEAERYYREGRRVVARPVETYPLTAVILAAVVGYGLGWLVHGRPTYGTSGRGAPTYGRRPGTPNRRPNRGREDAERTSAGREAGAASSAPSSF